MYQRSVIAVGAATGGLIAVAFLNSALALATSGDEGGSNASTSAATGFPDVPGKDAFTVGRDTFDPFTIQNGAEVEGFAPVSPLFSFAPFAEIGGGNLSIFGNSAPLAVQAFDIYSTGSTPSMLGIVNADEDVAAVLGMTNVEFIISNSASASGVEATALPSVGTVYDVLNIGGGLENVYVETPGVDGTVTDTLVTPVGNIDLSSLFGGFDASGPIDPGDAFSGLAVSATTVDPTDVFGI